MGKYENAYVLPLTLFVLIPVTFLTTYSLSVFWGHVVPTLPYISETGVLSPENCIFGQLLNIAAVLFLCCVYIRHRQVSQFSVLVPKAAISRKANWLATFFGVLSCLGLDLVANFQYPLGIHLVGAITCFTAGSIYFCMQTLFSANMCPYINSQFMVYFRGLLSFLAIFFTCTTIYPGHLSVQQFKGESFRHWKPEDGGWEWHLVSTASEWLLAMTYCASLSTFIGEFRNIRFHSPVIELTLYEVESTIDRKRRKVMENRTSQNIQEIIVHI